MAGEWIKMRASLATCPRVASMARIIGGAEEFRQLSRHSMRLIVIGGLHAVWCAVNEHTTDGVMKNAYPEDLDDIAGITGFGEAMKEAGWVKADETVKMLTFPNFGQWNTPAKDTTAAERMRKHREKHSVARNTVTVTEPLRATVAPDKTRQDKNISMTAAPSPASRPRSGHSPAADGPRWTPAAGWEGITDTDRADWAKAYPAASLEQELAKASAWLKANPERAKRKNWRRFLTNWLTRCQDKGGSNRGVPGNRPAFDDKPPSRTWSEADKAAFEATKRKLAASVRPA